MNTLSKNATNEEISEFCSCGILPGIQPFEIRVASNIPIASEVFIGDWIDDVFMKFLESIQKDRVEPKMAGILSLKWL